MKKPITPDQFRQNLRTRGLTIKQWAHDNGFRQREVYDVLNGIAKGHFGRAHEIAVAMGLKPSTTAEDSNPQRAKAA